MSKRLEVRNKRQRRMIDMGNYATSNPKPGRASNATSAYAVRNQSRRQQAGQAIAGRPKAAQDNKRPLHKALAIVSGILLVPLFIITPFVVAVTLNQHFPMLLR